jgi:hypothetical protein
VGEIFRENTSPVVLEGDTYVRWRTARYFYRKKTDLRLHRVDRIQADVQENLLYLIGKAIHQGCIGISSDRTPDPMLLQMVCKQGINVVQVRKASGSGNNRRNSQMPNG